MIRMIYEVNTRIIGEEIADKIKKECKEDNCDEVSWDEAEEMIDSALANVRGAILNRIIEKLEENELELI